MVILFRLSGGSDLSTGQELSFRDLMRADVAEVSGDRLEKVRAALREARNLQEAIDELEWELEERRKELTKLRQKELPDLFAQVGIDKLGLPAEGNHDAYDCKLRPYYKAVMPKDDGIARQGYEWLERDGSGDLVRHVVVADLDKNSQEMRERIEAFLDKLDIDYETKRTIPWATLTAWLKQRHEVWRAQQGSEDDIPLDERVEMPPLDLIGGTIGQQVDIKARKTK